MDDVQRVSGISKKEEEIFRNKLALLISWILNMDSHGYQARKCSAIDEHDQRLTGALVESMVDQYRKKHQASINFRFFRIDVEWETENSRKLLFASHHVFFLQFTRHRENKGLLASLMKGGESAGIDFQPEGENRFRILV